MSIDPFDGIRSLADLIAWRADNQGDEPAFAFVGRDVEVEDTDSFGTLGAASTAIAQLLCESGVRPGESVIVANSPGLGFVRALWGVWLAGAVAVPCYPPRTAANAQRLAEVLRVTNARFALGQRVPAQEAGQPALADCLWLDTDHVDARPTGDWRPPPRGKDDTALIQFTSGSVMAPKGVILSHGNILANARQIQTAFMHTSKSRGLIWLPPYHDMGLMGGIVQPVFAGFRTTLMTPRTFLRHPLNWLKAITRSRATVSGGPNFAYQTCLGFTRDEIDAADIDLSTWLVAFNGAEPVAAETLHAFAQKFGDHGFRTRHFMCCYGLAEASLYVSGTSFWEKPRLVRVHRAGLARGHVRIAQDDAPGTRLFVSCGMPGPAVRVVNPDTLQPCRMAEVGEIWVHGDNVGAGYHALPAETAASFGAWIEGDERSWLRSGDAGFLHGGELYVTGRIKDLIIVNGRNHHPEDIEATLRAALASTNVLPSVAVSIQTKDGDTELEALAVVQEADRSLSSADAGQQIDLIRTTIAREHGIAADTVLLVARGAIPKTASGKVRRAACRDLLAAGDLEPLHAWREHGAMPRAEALVQPKPAIATAPPELRGLSSADRARTLREWLMHVLSEIMQVRSEELNPDMHFGLYGIDSITAIGAIAHISEVLGLDLDDSVLWDYPNFNLLSVHLAEQLRPSPAAMPSELAT